MPPVAELQLPNDAVGNNPQRQATHEDYTLKILLDSSLSPVIEKYYAPLEITPRHVACLVSMEAWIPTRRASSGQGVEAFGMR